MRWLSDFSQDSQRITICDAQAMDSAAAGLRPWTRARVLERQKMSLGTHSDFGPPGIWRQALKDAGLRSPGALLAYRETTAVVDAVSFAAVPDTLPGIFSFCPTLMLSVFRLLALRMALGETPNC